MSKFISLTILLLFINSIKAQFTNYESTPERSNQPDSFYGGEHNFLGEYAKNYIGQDLCFVEERGKFLYLLKSIKGNTFTRFEGNSKNATSYDVIAKSKRESTIENQHIKYFRVIDVVQHPKLGKDKKLDEALYQHIYFLKIRDSDDGKIYYYKYDTRFSEEFPFITFMYYATQKQLILNTSLEENKIPQEYLYDIHSGKSVAKNSNNIWTCTNLVMDVRRNKLAAQYTYKKSSILVPYEYLKTTFDLNRSVDLRNQIDLTSIRQMDVVFPVINVHEKNADFDFTKNHQGTNPYPYIGREIFIKPSDSPFRDHVFSGFNNKKGSSSKKLSLGKTYSSILEYGFFSSYESLVGRYFKVVNVFPDPSFTNKFGKNKKFDYYWYGYRHHFYLELEDTNTKENIYYRYDGGYDNLPFEVVDTHEYLKDSFAGKQLRLDRRGWNSVTGQLPIGLRNLQTGQMIEDVSSKIWTCIDINFVDDVFCFILESQQKEVTYIPHMSMIDDITNEKQFKIVGEAPYGGKEFTANELEIVKEYGVPIMTMKSDDNQFEKWVYYMRGKELRAVVYFKGGIVAGIETWFMF